VHNQLQLRSLKQVITIRIANDKSGPFDEAALLFLTQREVIKEYYQFALLESIAGVKESKLDILFKGEIGRER